MIMVFWKPKCVSFNNNKIKGNEAYVGYFKRYFAA